MPLHLLGKKSWNVYNADNIARVQRDEAAAKAKEEAEDERMQEVDAQRRLAILRGEVLPPLPDHKQQESEEPTAGERSRHPRTSRKERKRPGEDDTDFDLRIASEKNQRQPSALTTVRQPTSSAPIFDHTGHIDLFGNEKLRAHAEKNEEAEKESRKKKKEYEDQYTMRFSNAAGREGLHQNPWYSQADAAMEPPSKDVWGNEDPRRKERQAQRIISNDPLAMMKKGASKVREIKQERKRAQRERDGELAQLRKEEQRRERRSRRDEDESRTRDRDSRRRHSGDRHNEHRHRKVRDREGREHAGRRSRSPDSRRHTHRHETR